MRTKRSLLWLLRQFIVVGTDEYGMRWSGIYKSSDNGANWTQIAFQGNRVVLLSIAGDVLVRALGERTIEQVRRIFPKTGVQAGHCLRSPLMQQPLLRYLSTQLYRKYPAAMMMMNQQ